MYLACDRRGRLSVACFGGSQAVARAGSALKRAWTLESCQPSDAANRPSSSASLPAVVGAPAQRAVEGCEVCSRGALEATRSRYAALMAHGCQPRFDKHRCCAKARAPQLRETAFFPGRAELLDVGSHRPDLLAARVPLAVGCA